MAPLRSVGPEILRGVVDRRGDLSRIAKELPGAPLDSGLAAQQPVHAIRPQPAVRGAAIAILVASISLERLSPVGRLHTHSQHILVG
jgi:hypothetical protein